MSLIDIEKDTFYHDYPVLQRKVQDKKLIYLDNAATTQKPYSVINKIAQFYQMQNSNIHRSAHSLSAECTLEYDNARSKVAEFLGGTLFNEIIFTKGCTEAINLVSFCMEKKIQKDDEIWISPIEHHANILPWQRLCKNTGAKLKIIPMNDQLELEISTFEHLITERAKLVAVTHISNALGVVNPVESISRICKKVGALLFIDGAQAVSHTKVNVKEINADFYALSGHKMFGPTGIGVLYAKEHLLNEFEPYQLGGGMIEQVTFHESTFAPIPYKFEAGTPPIAGALGLAQAIDYISETRYDVILQKERLLYDAFMEMCSRIKEIKIYGHKNPHHHIPVFSFNINRIHPHDISTIFDSYGIAIRSGHHCCQPLMQILGVPATARISFAYYNSISDIHIIEEAIKKSMEIFIK